MMMGGRGRLSFLNFCGVVSFCGVLFPHTFVWTFWTWSKWAKIDHFLIEMNFNFNFELRFEIFTQKLVEDTIWMSILGMSILSADLPIFRYGISSRVQHVFVLSFPGKVLQWRVQ